MAQNNIIKIGNALKWRGVFDESKKYYQENIVTLNGSIFRCKILQNQALPPVEIDEETGYVSFVNPDVWDVVVDMAFYYNYVIEQKNFNAYILEKTTQIESDIESLQKDNHHQWKHIQRLENISSTNQKEIDFIYALLNEQDETDKAQQKQIEELEEKCRDLEQQIQNFNPGTSVKKSVISNGFWNNGLFWENYDSWKNIYDGSGNSDCCGGSSNSNQTKSDSVVSNGNWHSGLSWNNERFWENYLSISSCDCDPDEVTRLKETVNSLAETVKKQGQLLDELLNKFKGAAVRVKAYNEPEKTLELEGDIEVTNTTPEGTLTISVPSSIVIYSLEQQSLELS